MQKLFDRIFRKLKAVLFGHYRPDFNSAWLEQNGHAIKQPLCQVSRVQAAFWQQCSKPDSVFR